MPRPLPEAKSTEAIIAEYRRSRGEDAQPVKIVSIDVSFGDIAALALKLGVVWGVLGAIGYLLYRLAV